MLDEVGVRGPINLVLRNIAPLTHPLACRRPMVPCQGVMPPPCDGTVQINKLFTDQAIALKSVDGLPAVVGCNTCKLSHSFMLKDGVPVYGACL